MNKNDNKILESNHFFKPFICFNEVSRMFFIWKRSAFGQFVTKLAVEIPEHPTKPCFS